MNNHRGFTLVEAMITVVFFSLIVGACFLLSKVGNDSWQVNSTRVDLAQNNRRAVDWLMNELRQSSVSTIVDVPANGQWYDQITFKIPQGIVNGQVDWSAPITYALGGDNQDQFIRSQGGQERVLANYFSSIQFKREAANSGIVHVNLVVAKRTARATQSLDLTTHIKIKLRND